MRHAIGMAYRVLHREDPAPRVAQHRNGVQSEITPHAVQVLDLRADSHLVRHYVSGGPPASSLVVVDDAERVRESIHLGKQVVVVEVRTTMKGNDRLALADGSVVQPSAG